MLGRRKKSSDSSSSAATLKLYYASDVHGSDLCWRKFLGAGRFYDVQALIMGGDLTGKAIVPYGWVATTLAVVANIHLAATLRNSPWCEYTPLELYPDQELRRNLFGPEPRMVDGVFELPTGPGLGVEVDEEALRHYRVA